MMKINTIQTGDAEPWLLKCINNSLTHGFSSEECKVLEIFMRSTLADVDIKKKISTVIIPIFFENLISRNVNKQAIDAQAFLIRLFVKYYGATCGQFKNTLNKFVSKALREYFNEENIVLKVTKCLALYPQCCGRGQQGINHTEAWTSQFNDYVYSANYFLHLLYSNVDFFLNNVTDIYEGKFDISVFNLSELEKATPKERYEKLTSLFIFFNTAIESMLLSMFSAVKHFDPNIIIQLALNTLSVTSEKLTATVTTEDVIALDLVLWKLHCSVLKIISALIKCCGRILIPQGVLICRVLIQSLIMTNTNSSDTVYGATRSKLQQRLLTYQVLCLWQAVAGSQSSMEMFSENLTSGILFDIKYNKPSLDLIVDKTIGNKKRKSGALNEKIINQRDTIVMHDYHANKTICNEAHKTLQLFLHTMSSNLKPLQFKSYQITIMGLLLEITACQQPNEYPLPYYDNSCRLNLYKSLLATVISPHPDCIAHTSVALSIFTNGTTDHNADIKENCRLSLSKLEHIIRPRNDTLFFPLENKIEISQPDKVIIPENKTYFLNTLFGDMETIKAKPPQELKTNNIKPIAQSSETVFATNVEAKQTQDSIIDNIKPIASSSETVFATNIEAKQTQDSIIDNIKPIASSSETVFATNIEAKQTQDSIIDNIKPIASSSETVQGTVTYDSPTKPIPQKITINNDQSVLTELSNKSSTVTPINANLGLESNITEPMDMESTIFSFTNKLITENDEYLEMIKDFVICD